MGYAFLFVYVVKFDQLFMGTVVQHSGACSRLSFGLVFLGGVRREAAEHPKQLCSQPSVKATDATPVSGVLLMAQVLQWV